jgi:signal transduction histidine kinase
MKYKLGILSIFFSFYFAHAANSKNTKDSATQTLYSLSEAYQKGKLPEKVYLDTVHNTMRTFLSRNIFFTHKELLQMLDLYRQLIWKDKKNEGRKREYYGILSNQAQMSDRNGEMLYYAEKIDKLERETKKRQSLTALSIIAIYYDGQRSDEEIKALYEKEKSYLQRIPVIFDKEKLDENDLVQASMILELSARALYELHDTLSGAEAEDLLERLAAIARAKYKQDIDVMTRITISQMLAFYRGAVAKNSPMLMQEAFRRMEALLTEKNTPDYIMPYMQLTIAEAKTAYYIHYANSDSASYYLGRYEEMMKGNPNLYNSFVLKKYQARLLYLQGKYKESADMHETAMNILDSSRSILVRDIDNMMYARAETEEQQLLLADAAVRNRETERRFLLASAAIAILLIGGAFSIRYIRKRQKNKLVKFKLNMARNIHDETNPALLYAKALIKASRTGENREIATAELDSHIGYTMELIRSLSHDLKSDKQYVLNDLVTKTEQTLKKLNTGNDFTFTIQTNIDKKRFISHYQFSQLMSVLNECITNTIKHASFNKINATFINSGNKLTISYNDNGKGWEPQQEVTGIGVRNMAERIRQINGDWQIDNDYPNGYRINISGLLR